MIDSTSLFILLTEMIFSYLIYWFHVSDKRHPVLTAIWQILGNFDILAKKFKYEQKPEKAFRSTLFH